MTVFLTTHYMEEAERLADRVAVVVQGRIVAEGTPGSLAGRDRAAVEIRFSLPQGASAEDLPGSVRCAVVGRDGDRLLVQTASAVSALGPLVRWAEGRQVDLPDPEVWRPSLEDVYLALTAPEQLAAAGP